MITRRDLLKGAAAGVAVSAAASTLIRDTQGPNVLEAADHNVLTPHVGSPHNNTCPYGCGVQYEGFGLASVKREGHTYYLDPMDDPNYRGPRGQQGKYAINGHGHQS